MFIFSEGLLQPNTLQYVGSAVTTTSHLTTSPEGRDSVTALHLCNLDITIFYKIHKMLIPADINDI
jgi:hypothetical protein